MENGKHIVRLAHEKNISLREDMVLGAEKFAKKYVSYQQMQEAFLVAKIILDFSPDEDTLVTSILLKLVDMERPPFEEIKQEFGETVATLLRSLHSLVFLTDDSLKKPEVKTEVLRKMFLALAKDIRVVLLKLANRLYSLQKVQTHPTDKQKIYAQEVFELYAPIASRLGIYKLKRNLEDFAFKILFPREYNRIVKKLEHITGLRKGILKKGEKEFLEILRKSNIAGRIESRIKDPYSIYQKLKKKEASEIEDINDLFAFRVLVPSSNDCYFILGKIHQRWKVMQGRFKDYITVPKPNGYKSLHTSILSDFYKNAPYPVEIQIRTFEMHEEAEFGSAVHWNYKESRVREKIGKNWFADIAKASKKLSSMESFEIFMKDFLENRIFVLTDQGDIKILTEGSTPIDFAYSVHTHIGEHCQSAIINGKIAPLTYTLQNGDIVKIITNRKVSPRESWLSIARSATTRQKIRASLRKHDKDFFIREGRKMLNATLKSMGAKDLDAKLLPLRNYDTGKPISLRARESILQRIGVGDLSAQIVAKKLINTQVVPQKIRAIPQGKNRSLNKSVIIAGERGFQTKQAKCCNPKPGDLILAFVTRTGSCTLHKRHCKGLRKLDPQRFLTARWENDPDPAVVHFMIEKSPNRFGIIQEISMVFTLLGINLREIHYSGSQGRSAGGVRIFVTLEVLQQDTIPKILKELQDIVGVQHVQEIAERDMPYGDIPQEGNEY